MQDTGGRWALVSAVPPTVVEPKDGWEFCIDMSKKALAKTPGYRYTCLPAGTDPRPRGTK